MKNTIKFIGIVGMLSSFLVMYWTFMTAFLNKSKSTVVFINKFGEANLEFILLNLFLLCIIPAAYFIIDEIAKEKQTNPEHS